MLVPVLAAVGAWEKGPDLKCMKSRDGLKPELCPTLTPRSLIKMAENKTRYASATVSFIHPSFFFLVFLGGGGCGVLT